MVTSHAIKECTRKFEGTTEYFYTVVPSSLRLQQNCLWLIGLKYVIVID